MMCGRRMGHLVVIALAATASAVSYRASQDPMGTVSEKMGPVSDKAGDGMDTVGGGVEKIQQVPIVGKGFQTNALSTSLSCVINLSVQYMVVYTALAVAMVIANCRGKNEGDDLFVEVLKQGTLTVNYAPMLACLFLAARMRVNWLTQGKGHPPTYVQIAMLCCTYALLAMTVTALVIPIFTGEKFEVNKDTGDLHGPSNGPDDIHVGKHPDHPFFKNTIVAVCFTVLKYLIMIFLYVGAVIVVVGIITYKPPKGAWPGDKIPPPAPAVACTMILTGMYFIIYAGIQIGKTFQSFSGIEKTSKLTGALQGAICTMFFAPMLSVLFIAARMRALQMDPLNGHPQKWAQYCFYACTYALLAQVILAVAIPLVAGGTVVAARKRSEKSDEEEDKRTGDVKYKVENQMCMKVLEVMRWIIMLSIYGGFTCVIYSIFTLQHPRGPEYTPPISVTMQCVINLAVQFFVVYLLIWIAVTAEEVTGWNWHIIKNPMLAAEGTVAFCPMLAILFVGVRMRALRLTNNRGAPQGYVQDGMYCATWAILIQFLMVCLMPIAIYMMEGKWEKPAVDEHGNIKHREWSKGGMIMYGIVEAVRWLGFVLLYGGVIAVIVGAINMTPENANGRGALPLVRDTPIGQEPKGVNDVPGVDRHVGHGGKSQDMGLDDAPGR